MEDDIKDKILKRLIKYCRIDTTSDRHSTERPTTKNQWKLAELLKTELTEIGIENAVLDKNCYITALIKSNTSKKMPCIGFISHIDTSSEVSGKSVNPVIHNEYNGEKIILKNNNILDPEEFPELLKYKGRTIITSDGTTLLGADNKAGIAEIMTAAEYLLAHPEIMHGDIEIIFTPDEETGFGTELFPFDKIKSKYCYTVDGSAEGTIETECFNAYGVSIIFNGKSIHLGEARGKFINAVEMASTFIEMIPKSESPQATDNRYGYYCPLEIKGNAEKTCLEIFLRDFDENECLRRINVLKSAGETLEKIYPGSRVTVNETKQYSNMKSVIDKYPLVISKLKEAVKKTGMEPVSKIIRGGTDGAKFSEKGIPTPNIFTGGHNFHSCIEWAALPAMVRAAVTIINLAELWAE